MANRKLDRRLSQARKAYRKRDKRAGARFVDEVLQQDFNYPPAWELLYELYGVGVPYEEFRRVFTARFFPEKLDQLTPLAPPPRPSAAGGAAVEKKPSFFSRLFGSLFRHKAKPEEEPIPLPSGAPAPLSQPAASAPAAATAAPPSAQLDHRYATASAIGVVAPIPPVPARAPGEVIRVILVDDITQTRETIVRSLRFQDDIDVVATASNGLQAIQLVRQLKPDVVVMDVNMPDMDGITATANIKRDVPNTEIVILTVQDDLDYMRRAMLAGARDFLTKPPMIDELVLAVERAGAQAFQNRKNRPAMAAALPAQARRTRGRIITVYSPRGGSGCTMLAVNLALGLHSEEHPAAIIDGDLQFGDVPVLFNTQSPLGIADLAPRVDELDPELVNDVLVKHPSGVKILHPTRPERAELITGPQFAQLATYFSELFPYVVLDTSHRLNDITLAALDVSDLTVLVSTLDIPSISRVRKFIELAPLLNLSPKKIALVVNMFDPRVGISPEKLPQAFGHEPAALIPLAYSLVLGSVNNGIPLLAKREMIQQPAGEAVVRLVKHLRQRLREAEQAEKLALAV
ncbi:MAG: hypothetical protein B6D39_00510 [Anaerolineae bacterium UTCFX2]|jgi:pilus assembly protein CpaE|nr:response regulator [Anaerolineales bacterium]OQY94947.1 MAG: hypothetical protein B6D39_00510 [Anaerolineae bacterium UTCFX2]